MKYFSPHLLDGSVTTPKLAADAVVKDKIKFAVGGQSGIIAADNRVTILLHTCALFPHIESENPTNTVLRGAVVAHHRAVPDPLYSTPQFDIMNQDAVNPRDYGVEWLYIDV